MRRERSRKYRDRLSAFTDYVEIGSLTEGGNLLDRAVAHKIHQMIEERLRRLPKQSVLLIDFSGVRCASHSALREVLDVLRTARAAVSEGKNVVFQLDMTNHDVIESVEVTARDRGYTVPAIDTSGRWHVIGKLTKSERETMSAVLEYEEITSTQLTARLSIHNVAASNRLRSLYERGLIKREERSIPRRGGRQFIYKPLISRKRPGEG